MKEEHYAANGFFITGANAKHPCKGYLMKNLIAGFDHAYGMYVFECIGGRMTQSTGYGNGDSGFYIGGTPFQKKPVWSSVDHDTAYENVLGYSGTNSKYVKITNGMFYNNGAGIVPNTLASEPFQPATDGIIANNKIFWNNFDYYLPGSPVKTVSSGLADDRRRQRQLSDRRRRHAVRDDRVGRQEQPDLRQLAVGRRRVLQPADERPRRSTTATSSSTTRWARTART